MTPMMQADQIAQEFNATAERNYWRAAIAGTRTAPTVNFNSRSSMVQITYYPLSGAFTLTFNRANCSFGDFVASAFRSLSQVLQALKAAGMDIDAPLDDNCTMRMAYDGATKQTTIHMAKSASDWTDVLPLSFKVPEE